MRLAVFSPWPPVRSGIADYTRDVVSGLAGSHELDLFVATPEERAARAPAGVNVRDAHEFPWRVLRQPYDLTVYQLGNAACHAYMWPYLFRYPGLVVLHDGQLHHARASALLRRDRRADYRAELAFNHPDLPAEAAEPAIHGMDGALYYFWPMLGTVMASARAIAVHSPSLARTLRQQFPNVPLLTIAMGVPGAQPSEAEVRAVRERHGIAPDALVLAAFGGVTPEKRLVPLLAAASIAHRYEPGLRILLVGPGHQHFDVMAAAQAAGVEDLVIVTGYVPDVELPAYLGASDIVSSLRFPTARETSASWLRALAAGRATIVTDLAQQADVPTLDPRSWTVLGTATSQSDRPVAVSVSIVDESHSLVLALKRLCTDATLRRELGAAGRAYWEDRHTIGAMLQDYAAALSRAAASPSPLTILPAHLRPDGLEHARRIAESMGVTLPDAMA